MDDDEPISQREGSKRQYSRCFSEIGVHDQDESTRFVLGGHFSHIPWKRTPAHIAVVLRSWMEKIMESHR